MSETRAPSRLLAGRYELGPVIGRGGMGTVHRATDRVLHREVAVKLLPAAVALDDPTSVARFEREARAAAGLRHPGVVFVYDAGVDDHQRFIVMELIEGRSLEAVVREDAPLAPERAAAIAGDVADALAAAHAAGIVHRDIKPANVMIGAGDAVKVLDFGIARSEGATTLTVAASVVGTAAYLAPEVAAGRPADSRSDVYALGCVLYAMLTGGPPFRGERIEAVMHQHATAAPRSPRAANARVPAELSALNLAMLEKRPQDRPGSMIELRDRLAALAVPAEPTAATHVLAASAAATAATRVLPVPPLSATRVVRSSTRLAPVLAILGVVVLLAVIIASAGGGGPAGRTAASTGKRPAARAGTTAAAHTQTASTSTPATTPTPTTTTPSLAATASTLASQIASAVQSGSLPPDQAHHLTDQLQHVMEQIAAGHIDGIAAQLADLTNQLHQLTTPAPGPGNGKGKGKGKGNGNSDGNGD